MTETRNLRKTRVGITEDQKRIGLDLIHQLIGAVDDITDSCAEIVANRIHINFWIGKLQILEENAVEIIVIVLTRMCKDSVKVCPALIDNCGKTDNLRTCSDDN